MIIFAKLRERLHPTSRTVTIFYYPPLTGTVSITGDAWVGETLTANTANLGGSGTISYQWQRGGTNVGGNSSTYLIQAADAGSTIRVTVTRSGNSGNVTSSSTASVISLNLPPISGWPSTTHRPLTENVWTDGNITSPDNGEIWYSFYAASGTTYRVWWNESSSDGTKTLDVRVRAYDSNGTVLFNEDSGWSTARTISLISGGTVYLRVTPFTTGRTGTFGIVYSTSSTRP